MWCLIWAIGVVSLCTSPVAGQHAVSVEGRVRTEDGRVIPTVVYVRVETVEGMLVAEQPASSDGEYKFAGLDRLRYRIIATAEGFETFRGELDLEGINRGTTVNIQLKALENSRVVHSQLPSVTDMAAPRKARKEFEKGREALDRNEISEAQIHLQRAVREYPCYARAQTHLALALATRDDLKRAAEALHKALKCDADYLPAYTFLGLLLNRQRDFAGSEKILHQGLRRAPNAWDLHYQLGLSLFGHGQYEQAKAEFLKAQALNPSPPAEIHAQLAEIYFREKAVGKAYIEMQTYLALEPDGRFAGRIRTLMHEIETGGSRPEPTLPQESVPPKL
jgi:tetratricopeptide (TPR) repeat protein